MSWSFGRHWVWSIVDPTGGGHDQHGTVDGLLPCSPLVPEAVVYPQHTSVPAGWCWETGTPVSFQKCRNTTKLLCCILLNSIIVLCHYVGNASTTLFVINLSIWVAVSARTQLFIPGFRGGWHVFIVGFLAYFLKELIFLCFSYLKVLVLLTERWQLKLPGKTQNSAPPVWVVMFFSEIISLVVLFSPLIQWFCYLIPITFQSESLPPGVLCWTVCVRGDEHRKGRDEISGLGEWGHPLSMLQDGVLVEQGIMESSHV